MLKINQIYQGDCLAVMDDIDDHSVDMILCDLPYGITNCHWDIIIPFEPLWKQYKRVIKDNGVIVLTATQPFTSLLVTSNITMFKYELIWEKSYSTGFMNCNKMPLKTVENILIFYNKLGTYNPQGLILSNKTVTRIRDKSTTIYNKNGLKNITYNQEYTNYPTQIIKTYKKEKTVHPTQKPLELFEYLIKTYSNENDVVLDNCAGSCTTAVACQNLNRNWICIEQESNFCEIGRNRLNENEKRLYQINTLTDIFNM